MEHLGKAARAFSGTPVERSDNTGAARMFEHFLLEQKVRVPQPPKMRETFAVLACTLNRRRGNATIERAD